MLVAAAWIAVAARDRDVVLLPQTEAERIAAEHMALLVAARVRLRTAQDARDQAPWYRAWIADRAVREAEDELRQVEAATPKTTGAASSKASPVKVPAAKGADSAGPKAAAAKAPAAAVPASKGGGAKARRSRGAKNAAGGAEPV
jgi:membrane protein